MIGVTAENLKDLVTGRGIGDSAPWDKAASILAALADMVFFAAHRADGV